MGIETVSKGFSNQQYFCDLPPIYMEAIQIKASSRAVSQNTYLCPCGSERVEGMIQSHINSVDLVQFDICLKQHWVNSMYTALHDTPVQSNTGQN
jgi:hypothetical protein